MQLNHPEQRKGEAFYCNAYDEGQLKTMHFKTRMGKIAYSLTGKKIEQIEGVPFPVFVQKSELDQRRGYT